MSLAANIICQHHLPASFVSIICQREIYSKSGSFTERASD